MKFSIRIALRYLISRNSLTVVNRVNLFAIVVLIVSSSSLFIVLSGFDGLKDFGMGKWSRMFLLSQLMSIKCEYELQNMISGFGWGGSLFSLVNSYR